MTAVAFPCDPVLTVERVTAPAAPAAGAWVVDGAMVAPEDGTRHHVHSLKLQGWVVGRERRVAGVELVHEEQVLRRMPANLPSPEAAERHPQVPWAANCEFRSWHGTIGFGFRFELHLRAVFDDGTTAPFLTIHCRRGARISTRYEPQLQPLMVTSIGRTGTTWLMRLLSEHPSIVTHRKFPYETRAGFYWAHLLDVLSQPADHAASAHTDYFHANLSWAGFNPFYDEGLSGEPERPDRPGYWLATDYVESLAAFCQRSADGFYGYIAWLQQQHKDPRYFAEKYHVGAKAIWVNWELYPAAREIILVRDLRDMFCSMLAFNAKRGRDAFGRESLPTEHDFVQHVRGVAAQLLHAWQSRRELALLVRYEDVVLRPHLTLRRMFEYVGVDASAEAVQAVLLWASRDADELQGHRTTSDVRTSVGRWRQAGDGQRRMMRAAFDDLMREFGYELSADGDVVMSGPDIPRETAVQAEIREVVPPAATVLVVSDGDDALLELSVGRRGWHFPRTEQGCYAGRPGHSDELVGNLESLRDAGATHLLVPSHALWWLDHYGGLREHLRRRYEPVVRGKCCVVYDLRQSGSGSGGGVT
jgi:hypothetical protein